MRTLYDFGMEVQKIREAINSLTIQGASNASLITYAFNKCNDIINEINRIAEEQTNLSQKDQNGENELHVEIETTDTQVAKEGEVDGKPD